MEKCILIGAALAVSLASPTRAADNAGTDVTAIQNLVVIYAENRSFDNLFGSFPGANGLADASEASKVQLDRDGTPLEELPFPSVGRRLEALELAEDFQDAALAGELRAGSEVLPAQQPAHELRGRDRLDLFA